MAEVKLSNLVLDMVVKKNNLDLLSRVARVQAARGNLTPEGDLDEARDALETAKDAVDNFVEDL